MSPELVTAIAGVLTAVTALVYAVIKARQGDAAHAVNAARIDAHDRASGVDTKGITPPGV